MLLAQPELYVVGRESQLYRSHSFWINVIDALYQSTVIFFVAYFVMLRLFSPIFFYCCLDSIEHLIISQAYNDAAADIWEFGTLITSSCIFVMLIHIASEFRSWVYMHFHFFQVILYFGSRNSLHFKHSDYRHGFILRR